MAASSLLLGRSDGLNGTSTPPINSTDYEFCFLPPGLVEYPNSPGSCPTQASILVSLLLFNCCSAALNLFLGHDLTRRAIREHTPSWLEWLRNDSPEWQPGAALCMTILQVVGMAASTGIARSNGFDASFSSLFGIWSLRPRMALMTFAYDSWDLWGSADKQKPFRWTLKDTLLSECLLNILSIPFASSLLSTIGQDQYGCQKLHESGAPNWYNAFKMALGWKIVGGVTSAFALAIQFIGYLNHSYAHSEPEITAGRARSKHLRHTAVFWSILMVTFINFITSWEIWGSE
jgi:hypothetical protein